MPTLEEVSAWSLEEILAAIQALLPKGTQVQSLPNAGGWTVRIDTAGTVVLEGTGADQRLTALNIYGQLWVKSLPKPSEFSPWVRRRELTGAQVTRKVVHNISDPEDLDPSEVNSVYEPFRK